MSDEIVHMPDSQGLLPTYLLEVSNTSPSSNHNENDWMFTADRKQTENMRMHMQVRDFLENKNLYQFIKPEDPMVRDMRRSYINDALPFQYTEPEMYKVTLKNVIKPFLLPLISGKDRQQSVEVRANTNRNRQLSASPPASCTPSMSELVPSLKTPPPPPIIKQVQQPIIVKEAPQRVAPSSPTTFSFKEEALTSLGPNVKCVRTGDKPWFLSDKMCKAFEYKCIRGENCCQAHFWVVYDLNNQSCRVLLYKEAPHNHEEVSWEDYYRYATTYSSSKEPKWNSQKYPRKAGLPPMIQRTADEYAQIAHQAYNISRIAVTVVQHSSRTNPWMRNTDIAEKMKKQVEYRIRNQRKLKWSQKMKLLGNPKAEVTGDLRIFIEKFSVKWNNLSQTWIPEPNITNEVHLEFLANTLHYQKVITPLLSDEAQKAGENVFLSQALIVLDDKEVPNHPRWQFLVQSKTHVTGEDTRGRTIVFSSLALLANVVRCQQEFGWDVCACVDGTHNVVPKSKYVLLAFGVNTRKPDGTRTFRPFAFAWGEGEREIVALHLFLNVQSAVKQLFGINHIRFNGGFVTDNADAFHNSIEHCFPDTQQLDCYAHVIRKFLVKGDRKGNGTYYTKYWNGTKNADALDWMDEVARSDIQNLSSCVTDEQQLAYWNLCRKAWEEQGQEKMYTTFSDAYMKSTITRAFRNNSSPLPAQPACGNPHESFLKLCKGWREVIGMLAAKNAIHMVKVLYESFPNLIDECSQFKGSINYYYPLDNPMFAFDCDSFRNYYHLFMRGGFEVNSVAYGNDGWLVNDTRRLGMRITEDVINAYEEARAGTLEVSPDKRSDLIKTTEHLHHVTKELDTREEREGDSIYHCTCREYVYYLYCHPVAILKHKDYFEKNMTQLEKKKDPNKMNKKQYEKYLFKKVQERFDQEDFQKIATQKKAKKARKSPEIEDYHNTITQPEELDEEMESKSN